MGLFLMFIAFIAWKTINPIQSDQTTLTQSYSKEAD